MQDPDVFFGESAAATTIAKALCQTCVVRAECLEGALAREERWGVWGGEVLLNGKIIAHKRGRGRPRKNARAS